MKRQASIITLALLLLPILAPLTATKAAAETVEIEVSATRINYNIILVKIKNVPSDVYPSVTVMPLDKNGNELESEPYYVIAGYHGGKEWHVLIALNKTFENKVFDYAYHSNSSTYINATDKYQKVSQLLGENVTIYTSNTSAGEWIVKDRISRVDPIITVMGRKIYNITILAEGGANFTGEPTAAEKNLTNAWPIVNALDLSSTVKKLRISVEAGDLGEAETTIDVG
ncbi:MAG: hypothetical protein DSY37_00310, partial [Hyperthermus sp.]